MECGFYCQLNRNALVNPYDIGGSSTSVSNALAKISDRTAAYNTQVTNLLGSTLSMLSLQASILVLSFVALAAPVIFMSWYSSTMLSDVSYNLRRREFGLLQTKGFGPKAIKRMLMLEGAIIGLIGGSVGFIGGAVLADLLVGAGLESLPVILTTNTMNIIVVMGFAVFMAVWSVRGPADRAAKLDPLDSLKQYVYIEEQREYKKLLPIIALLLGTYKLIVWVLGINMSTVLSSALSTNFVLLIVVALWTPVDAFLNYVGPIFFLYGATKILLRGSQKFQESVVRVGSRFFGSFGHLATRNLARHPARNAALVFVVSLIVSYGLSSVGSLFAEQDSLERTSLYEVGSDVSATFNPGQNMSMVTQTISTIPDVNQSTIEFRLTMSSTRGGLEVRGIDPQKWTHAAFYEISWFSGPGLDEIFSNFTGEQIILSITVARQLQLHVGNTIALRGPGQSTAHKLAIVGLVGYRSPFEDILGQFSFGGTYPSYVPTDFINGTGLTSLSNGWVLIRTQQGANGTLVEQEILSALPQATATDSLTSRMKEAQTNSYQVGGTRARWLGIIFAVVLAVVGTGLVVGLTLKEKEQETTLLSVRGLTRGQILKALTAEVMVMVLFSLILGVATGFIQLFGNIANTSQSTQELVRPRMVFSPLSILAMTGIVMLVVLAALIPIIMTSRVTEERVNAIRE
jgi:ABC-type lipoprotein release transport system permease subunit